MTSRRNFINLALASPLALSRAINADENRDLIPNPNIDLTPLLFDLRKKGGITRPALAAGVMKNGKLVASGAAGFRKLADPTPVTVFDKFHLGSCTKAFTATLAGILVDQGKIRWTTKIVDVFPERADRIHHGFRDATLELLLTHRAGVPPNSAAYDARKLSASATLQDKRLAYADSILGRQPISSPGTNFKYSNAGFVVACVMLERVAAEFWEELVLQRIYRPLGMASGGFGVTHSPNHTDQPWGHTYKDKQFQPSDWAWIDDNPHALRLGSPAGAIHCSVIDALKFLSLHTARGVRDPRLLSPATLAKLHQPIPISAEQHENVGLPDPEGYGMGWWVGKRDWAKGRALMHGGSDGSTFVFKMWIAPSIDFCMAFAMNSIAGTYVLDDLATELEHRFAG